MPNSKALLTVNWKLTYPLQAGHKLFFWPKGSQTCRSSSLKEDIFIEQNLGLARGTLAVLEKAFQYKLTRDQSWDLSNLSLKDPFSDASEIYLRGVCLYENNNELITKCDCYPIEIFHSETISPSLFEKEDFYIFDANILRNYPQFEEIADHIVENVSESHKTLLLAASLAKSWKDKRKKGRWVIVGGGTLGDVASFAAACVGSPFHFLPTTLLAMVDACVGGKTGVNYFPFGKNLIGRFSFPQSVSIYPQWLNTLSDQQFFSGGSECIKHALIAGDSDFLEDVATRLREKRVLDILPDLIAIKISIIQEDSCDRGKRNILNLGHTLAHALEAIAEKNNRQLLHGEAVAYGLAYTVWLSFKLNFMEENKAKKIIDIIKFSKCLQTLSRLQHVLDYQDDCAWNDILYYLLRDKKNISADKSEWVLLRDIGQVVTLDKKRFTVGVDNYTLKNVWDEFLLLLNEN